jgi:hypothetical protein
MTILLPGKSYLDSAYPTGIAIIRQRRVDIQDVTSERVIANWSSGDSILRSKALSGGYVTRTQTTIRIKMNTMIVRIKNVILNHDLMVFSIVIV